MPIKSYLKRIEFILPLVISFLIGAIFLIFLLNFITKLNGGKFIYALDDAYIHLAVAKNFALYKVWGVTKYQFSSSTSSLLWPLFLSLLMKIFGVSQYYPLFINIALFFAILLLSYLILKSHHLPSWLILVALLLIIFVTPLPLLVIYGLEHLLQIFLSLVFIYFLNKIVIEDKKLHYERTFLYLTSLFLISTRYDSFLIIIIGTFLLLLKRKFKEAFLVLVFSFLPIIIYGLISIQNGWQFFPRSVMLKSIRLINFKEIFQSRFRKWILSFLFLYLLLIFLRHRKTIISLPHSLFNIFYCLIFLFFVMFVSLFHSRYEAYMITLGILNLIILFFHSSAFELIKEKYLKTIIVACMILLIIIRVPWSVVNYRRASLSIYLQPYQMARFLARYYPSKTIGINDIGCVGFFTDNNFIDFFGLASINEDLSAGYNINDEKILAYKRQVLENIVQKNHLEIIIISTECFEKVIPSNWILVAKWFNPLNLKEVLGSSTISFYATKISDARLLKERLIEFEKELPPPIEVSYYFN